MKNRFKLSMVVPSGGRGSSRSLQVQGRLGLHNKLLTSQRCTVRSSLLKEGFKYEIIQVISSLIYQAKRMEVTKLIDLKKILLFWTVYRSMK